MLEDGHIGGLNGVLLAAAAEAGLNGACLLGEMPHVFAQLPFPKASHAILEAFTTLSGIDVDLTELAEQAASGELDEEDEEGFQPEGAEEDEAEEEPEDTPQPAKPKRSQIERLFE